MDSGTGGFWALILGLMFTLFGDFGFCYGLVKVTEKVVRRFQAGRPTPAAVPPLRRAA